ncbi:MAG: archease [Myxococcota bacterium]
MDKTQTDAGAASGYTEIEHTADWALEVWAPDFETLLLEATRGMYELAGVELGEPASDEEEQLRVDGSDREDLLVAWLSEVVFLWSARNEGLADLSFECVDGEVLGRGSLASIVRQDKEVKAVTYHGLDVRETGRGLEATVTFDV